jgi:membrane-associated phospholipid phosphatase
MNRKEMTARARAKFQEKFTLQMVVIFVVFTVAVLSFAIIADEVGEQETLAVDTFVLQTIHSMSTPFLDTVVPIITDIGGVTGGVLLTAFVCGLFLLRDQRRPAVIVAVSVAGAAGLNVTLKALFERSRPDLWDRLVVEHSYSFPSGHAMASAALGISLAAVLWNSRWRWWGFTAGLSYMVVIGFTRLYLGVHYPTDIIAGWCVSAAWVAIVVAMVTSRLGRIAVPKKLD